MDKTRRVDLMNIYTGDELFQPYETDDGWLVVLPGEDGGRREKYGKTLKAVTKVRIDLPSEEALEKCVVELEESDRRIRELSGGGDWDWQLVMVKGTSVKFGVAWYSIPFFEERKDAWSDPAHTKVYERFGATPENFTISHEVVA